MINRLIILAIKGYQKWLSPRKGYHCAHRCLHGDVGCSQAVINIFRQHSLLSAIKMSRKRFAACKSAAHILQAQAAKRRKKKREYCDYADCCNPCNFFDCSLF